MENAENSVINATNEKSNDRFSGFGEIAGDESENNLDGSVPGTLDGQNKKEPITILSVELVSSETGSEIQNEDGTNENSPSKQTATAVYCEGNAINENLAVAEEHVLQNMENVTDSSEASAIEEENNQTINSISDDTGKNGPNTDTIMDGQFNEEAISQFGMVVDNTMIVKDVHSGIPYDNTPLDNVNTSLISQAQNLETTTATLSTTGLSLLAQYGSDNGSDAESVIEVISNQDYRNKVVEIDSDSDSDSSSGSDVEYLNVLRKKIEKRMEVEDEDDEEDDNESVNRRKPKPKVKAKGELLMEDLPPIQDLQITVPEDECVELGKIHSIVDQLVLVNALPNSVLLDLDTVLFLDKGQKVLGEVFDVLGQVADPLYCVRFNSNSQINEKNIQVGNVVYVAPKTQYTQFIILSSLMSIKGSDASWENDIEPPPRFLEYSDDEQEQLARRQMRNRNRPTDHDDPEKKPRTDADDPQTSSSLRPPATQHRNRQPYPRSGGEVLNNPGSYSRPRHTHQSQYHNQQVPINHHPSSWHSNYYPQSYPVPPPNYGYGGYPAMPPVHNYPQVPPMYPMPSMHSVNYPMPPHHLRPPPNIAPAPGVFSMRPPTMGHFESSPPPPQ